jgi:ribosomal protein S8E
MQLLEKVDSATIENLGKHLAGTSEATQDFVRGTIARVTSRPNRRGN